MPYVVILLVGASVLLLLSVPIFLSLLLPSIVAFSVSDLGLPLVALPQRAVQGVNVFALLAIPMFIFAADVISRGEIGNRLVDVADSLVGHIPGGLAISTALTMAVFGAISGIGVAAVVSVGPIVYPALIRQGYSKRFSIGLILSGSTLSMLIPPSVAVILYCLQTGQSIAKVFLSAFGAGLVFLVLLIAYSLVYALRRGIGRAQHFSASALLKALKRGGWALMLPVIILGGIYSGYFTVTEAAAVSAVYAMFVEVCVYRRLKLRELLDVTSTSAATIAMLLILIAAGSIMTWFMTVQQVPQMIAGLIGSGSAESLLLIVNVIFLIAGMVIDPNSAIIVLAPLIFPAAMAVGIDPVHLGAVLTLNLAIGMISPPFGINLFVGIVTFKSHFAEVVRGCFPFLILALVALALVTYIPSLIMWLPELSSVR
ncbi:TRAP transporter large permease [Pusillimonas sp.]|uniref:TRAP transporter large permease n=1 Tax=Pusillimonas sp. TaxID=3040095 RepID=UPI0037C6E98A